jgi:hypothetical protein
VFHPTDPVPDDWFEGLLLNVAPEGVDPCDDPEAIEAWVRGCEATPPVFEPGELEEMERVLADADVIAKESVRRQHLRVTVFTTDGDFRATSDLQTEDWLTA